jgi:hypothetical protein
MLSLLQEGGTQLVSAGIGSTKCTCRMKGVLAQPSPRMPLTRTGTSIPMQRIM